MKTIYVDVIYSPDDGGWYAEEYDDSGKEIRVIPKKGVCVNAIDEFLGASVLMLAIGGMISW